MTIAADRGYLSELSVTVDIAKKLGMARKTVENMLATGRFTWERLLVLGAMFEMTPREFCGCFLDGYFQEDAQGHFVATVEDEGALLAKLPDKVHTEAEWESFFETEDI